MQELQYKYSSGEFLPTDGLMKFLAKHVCNGEQEDIQAICGFAVFLVCGFDPSNLNIVSYYSRPVHHRKSGIFNQQ